MMKTWSSAKKLTEYQRVKMVQKLLDDFVATVDREKLVREARGNLVVELQELSDYDLTEKVKKVTK
jgi:hypothetical protein